MFPFLPPPPHRHHHSLLFFLLAVVLLDQPSEINSPTCLARRVSPTSRRHDLAPLTPSLSFTRFFSCLPLCFWVAPSTWNVRSLALGSLCYLPCKVAISLNKRVSPSNRTPPSFLPVFKTILLCFLPSSHTNRPFPFPPPHLYQAALRSLLGSNTEEASTGISLRDSSSELLFFLSCLRFRTRLRVFFPDTLYLILSLPASPLLISASESLGI